MATTMEIVRGISQVMANTYDGALDENGLEQMIEDIASFLKKEYRKVTGESLTLTKDGEMKAIVQNTSRVRSWVQANCMYDIGGASDAPEMVNAGSDDRKTLDANFRDFLEQGGLKAD